MTVKKYWILVKGALRLRCPRCGIGKILHRYLKVKDFCPSCGEALGHFRADDAPPYLTLTLVGHVVVPITLFLLTRGVSTEVTIGVGLTLTTLLTLFLLPRMKSIVIVMLWSLEEKKKSGKR